MFLCPAVWKMLWVCKWGEDSSGVFTLGCRNVDDQALPERNTTQEKGGKGGSGLGGVQMASRQPAA